MASDLAAMVADEKEVRRCAFKPGYCELWIGGEFVRWWVDLDLEGDEATKAFERGLTMAERDIKPDNGALTG